MSKEKPLSTIQTYLEELLAWFQDQQNSKEAHLLHPHILFGFSKAFLSFLIPTALWTRKVCRRLFVKFYESVSIL